MWLNELVKLRRATFEQDNTGADPIWYRAMVSSLLRRFRRFLLIYCFLSQVEGVRAAFLQPEQAYMHPPQGGEEEEEQVEGEEGA